MTVPNRYQLDDDSDGIGNVCDLCPGVADPLQTDVDQDGAGDACDCQFSDPTDRPPAEIASLVVGKQGTDGALLEWAPDPAADAYSVLRGDLGDLASAGYGSCIEEGIGSASFVDPDPPALGTGLFYLVQAQNLDCGMGSLGFSSAETDRSILVAGACVGIAHADAHADGETPVSGEVTGDLTRTLSSDDVVESIKEERTGGPPSERISLLEHHWTIPLAAGSRIELHVEGFRTDGPDAEDFVFEYSTDGGSIWNPISMASLPLSDDHVDLVGALPAGLSGTVLFRVIDTDRTPGNQYEDTVSIDELFVRSIP
jgi:hypothetical protein